MSDSFDTSSDSDYDDAVATPEASGEDGSDSNEKVKVIPPTSTPSILELWTKHFGLISLNDEAKPPFWSTNTDGSSTTTKNAAQPAEARPDEQPKTGYLSTSTSGPTFRKASSLAEWKPKLAVGSVTSTARATTSATATTVASTTTVVSSTTVGSENVVASATTVTSANSVASATTVTSVNSVASATTVTSANSVASATTVTNATTVASANTVASAITVANATTVTSVCTVASTTTVTSATTVGSATTIVASATAAANAAPTSDTASRAVFTFRAAQPKTSEQQTSVYRYPRIQRGIWSHQHRVTTSEKVQKPFDFEAEFWKRFDGSSTTTKNAAQPAEARPDEQPKTGYLSTSASGPNFGKASSLAEWKPKLAVGSVTSTARATTSATATTVASTTTVVSATTVGSENVVASATTVTSANSVASATTVTSVNSVASATTVTSANSVASATTVTNVTTVASANTVASAITVANATTVTSASTVASTTTVTSATTVGSATTIVASATAAANAEASGQQKNATGTALVKYNPVEDTDVDKKYGRDEEYATKLNCVTCMKEYESKSLEELRLEDYKAGRRGFTDKKPCFGGSSLFGFTYNTGGLFGNTPMGLLNAAFGAELIALRQQKKDTTGTAHVKYDPVEDSDVDLKFGQKYATKLNCVTCMKEYESKSLEELRLEDYRAGRKNSTANIWLPDNKPSFDSSSPPAPPVRLFGNPTATPASSNTELPSRLFGFGASTSTGLGSNQRGLTSEKVVQVQKPTPLEPILTLEEFWKRFASTTAPSGISALNPSTTSTVTTPPRTSAATALESISFEQLEEDIKKWSLELGDQEKIFINEAMQINEIDQLLITNGIMIAEMNEAVQKVKNDQERLEQDIDILLAQEKELDEFPNFLDMFYLFLIEKRWCGVTNSERESMYDDAKNLEKKVQKMSEDLKEVTKHFSETNTDEDSNDPVCQIVRLLNEHMVSMQRLDDTASQISKKVNLVKAKIGPYPGIFGTG